MEGDWRLEESKNTIALHLKLLSTRWGSVDGRERTAKILQERCILTGKRIRGLRLALPQKLESMRVNLDTGVREELSQNSINEICLNIWLILTYAYMESSPTAQLRQKRLTRWHLWSTVRKNEVWSLNTVEMSVSSEKLRGKKQCSSEKHNRIQSLYNVLFTTFNKTAQITRYMKKQKMLPSIKRKGNH